MECLPHALEDSAADLVAGGKGIQDPARFVDGHVPGDLDVTERCVHLDFDKVGAETHAASPFRARRRCRRRDPDVGAAGEALFGDLPPEVACRLDHGVAGHRGCPASRLAHGVRAPVRVTPYDVDLREGYAEFLGRDQSHRRLRPRPDVGDPDEEGIALRGIDPEDRAARPDAGAEHHEGESGPALDGSGIGPRGGLPTRAPVEEVGARPDALVEGVVREPHLVGGTLHVRQREFDRIDADPVGDVVHHRLQREVALGVGGCPEVAGYHPVRVDGPDRPLHIRASVRVEPADPPRAPEVGTHPAQGIEPDRRHGAVAPDAHPEVLDGVPAAVRAQPVVLSREFEEDGCVRFPGEHRGD